jgi:hypothetical protein
MAVALRVHAWFDGRQVVRGNSITMIEALERI